MKIQVAYNEVTPLVKQDFTKLYDALKRTLSDDEMIFATHRAGFGGIVQWDLPDGLQWVSVTRANSFERNEAMRLLEEKRRSGAAKLGTRTDLIEAVYSVPSADFLYYARDAQGNMKVMLAGWAYRYPRTPAVNPLSWHPEDEQNVQLSFFDKGQAVATAIELRYATTFTKQLNPDTQGKIDLGTHRPGTQFAFSVPEYGRDFSFKVEKGRENYIFDLTVAQSVTVLPPVEPPIMEPPIIEPPIVDDPDIPIVLDMTKVSFIGYNGRGLESVKVRIESQGETLMSATTDSEGVVTFAKSELPCGKPLDVKLSGTPTRLPRTTIMLDSNENEYEVHYHPGKEQFPWLLIAGIFVAVAATAGAFLLSVVDV